MIPGSLAFIGLWLGGLALSSRGLLVGMVPVGLAVVLAGIAALSRAVRPRSARPDIGTAWAAALLLIAAVPMLVIGPLVLPAAATVRLVPGGSISASPFGIVTAAGAWPSLIVSLVVALLVYVAGWWWRLKLPVWPAARRPGFAIPRLAVPWPLRAVPPWTRFVVWGAFVALIGMVLTRP